LNQDRILDIIHI